MKKVTTILLLMIMLIIGVRPMLAYHFCNHDFQSVSLKNTDEGCCSDTSSKESEIPFSKLSTTHCCQTEIVKLSTDEFSHQNEDIRILNSLSIFSIIAIPVHSLDYRLSDTRAVTEAYIDPPEGVKFHHADIGTFICVYRI